MYFPNFGSQVLFLCQVLALGLVGGRWASVGSPSAPGRGLGSGGSLIGLVGGWWAGSLFQFCRWGLWARLVHALAFYGVDYIQGTVPSGVVCVFRFVNRFLWVSMSLGGCGVESLRKFHTYNYIHAFYTYMQMFLT